jgi:hypothetical protein
MWFFLLGIILIPVAVGLFGYLVGTHLDGLEDKGRPEMESVSEWSAWREAGNG